MTNRRLQTVALTLSIGQIEYIKQQTAGLRERSRWIRDAINMRIVAEGSKQVQFVNNYKTEVFNNALEIAQDKLKLSPNSGHPDSAKS